MPFRFCPSASSVRPDWITCGLGNAVTHEKIGGGPKEPQDPHIGGPEGAPAPGGSCSSRPSKARVVLVSSARLVGCAF